MRRAGCLPSLCRVSTGSWVEPFDKVYWCSLETYIWLEQARGLLEKSIFYQKKEELASFHSWWNIVEGGDEKLYWLFWASTLSIDSVFEVLVFTWVAGIHPGWPCLCVDCHIRQVLGGPLPRLEGLSSQPEALDGVHKFTLLPGWSFWKKTKSCYHLNSNPSTPWGPYIVWDRFENKQGSLVSRYSGQFTLTLSLNSSR